MLQRRVLGRTGLTVSELSLGTVELGLAYGIASAGEDLRTDESQAAAVLEEALALGVNLLDTARAYGEAEAIIGRALKGRRNEFYLVSKTSAYPGEPERVRRSVEESLRALDTGHIDVMLIHCGADARPDADTVAALAACRDTGLVRFLGASVYGEAAAVEAICSGWCDAIEVAYSALDRRPEARVLPLAAERNVGVMARSVLLKGALSLRSRHLPEEMNVLKQAIEALGDVDELPELSYRYVLSQDPPHTALAGTARIAELRACVEHAARGPLPVDVLARVRALAPVEEKWLNPGNWPAGV